MRFKTVFVKGLAGLLLISSCGPGDYGDDSEDFKVGRLPVSYSTSTLWGGTDDRRVAITDKETRSVQSFSIEPLAHIATLAFALPYQKQSLVASANGAYFVTIAQDQYAVLTKDGRATKNPEELVGTIESVAYSPSEHVLVLADEFKSLALIELSSFGTVTDSWRAGSLFEGKSIRSGTMISDGRLVLALDTNTVVVVDVVDAISEKQWPTDVSEFNLEGVTNIAWIAAVPDRDNVVLMVDDNSVFAVDVQAKSILGTESFDSGEIRLKQRDYTPHVIVRESEDDTSVVFIDSEGALHKQSFLGIPDRWISSSWLNADTGVVTIAVDPGQDYVAGFNRDRGKHEIYRFRLTDNLAMDKTVVSDSTRAIVSEDYLFLNYESALGRSERWSYGKDPKKVGIEGYNFEFIRGRLSK